MTGVEVIPMLGVTCSRAEQVYLPYRVAAGVGVESVDRVALGGDDYDVMYRRRSARGELGKVQRLGIHFAIDRQVVK
jgi:hypothetical protein